jgi:hypothetical protein
VVYRNIFSEFVKSGQRTLRLLPVSGGIFSGGFSAELPFLTFQGVQEGYRLLGDHEKAALMAAKQIMMPTMTTGDDDVFMGMCVFSEKELPDFEAAGFDLHGEEDENDDNSWVVVSTAAAAAAALAEVETRVAVLEVDGKAADSRLAGIETRMAVSGVGGVAADFRLAELQTRVAALEVDGQATDSRLAAIESRVSCRVHNAKYFF